MTNGGVAKMTDVVEAVDVEKMAEDFHRDGYVLIPGVLSRDEAARLRERTEEYFERRDQIDPAHVSYVGDTFVLRRGADLDTAYADLVQRPALRAVVEAVLGPEPAFNALNVIRNAPGQAIAHWHVDDLLEHPLPESIARFDPRIRMPVLWLTAQLALSDIETAEHGPTQFVPGSHYSGRHPSPKDVPVFEGRGAVSVLCRAGDVYLTNHQCWHRGAPNVSDRIRYVLQVQYATRWADRRFRGVA
jgi:ectoine hydroxylase-related dioxygenase (phytanoyl-CoA dioxygenase family)